MLSIPRSWDLTSRCWPLCSNRVLAHAPRGWGPEIVQTGQTAKTCQNLPKPANPGDLQKTSKPKPANPGDLQKTSKNLQKPPKTSKNRKKSFWNSFVGAQNRRFLRLLWQNSICFWEKRSLFRYNTAPKNVKNAKNGQNHIVPHGRPRFLGVFRPRTNGILRGFWRSGGFWRSTTVTEALIRGPARIRDPTPGRFRHPTPRVARSTSWGKVPGSWYTMHPGYLVLALFSCCLSSLRAVTFIKILKIKSKK